MNQESTVVIFRQWPESEGGECIAIFPYESSTLDPLTCESYQHTGQHGACDPMALTHKLRLSTPSEYAGLASELQRIGYVLDIRSRIPRDAFQARRAQIWRFSNPFPKDVRRVAIQVQPVPYRKFPGGSAAAHSTRLLLKTWEYCIGADARRVESVINARVHHRLMSYGFVIQAETEIGQ